MAVQREGYLAVCGPWLCAAFLVILLAGVAWGQSTTSTIVGTVTDPSGAAIADAQITATNLDTGLSRVATSDKTGAYRLALLPVGAYRVEATSRGFQRFVRDSVELEINLSARV